MHEWAIAEALVEYLNNYIKVNNVRRIKKLVVKLGELQAIDKDILLFSLNELLKIYSIPVEKIDLVDIDAYFQCRKCGHKWGLNDLNLNEDIREAIHFVPEVVFSYVKCPKCGSRDFEIISGRGVEIGEIVVE